MSEPNAKSILAAVADPETLRAVRATLEAIGCRVDGTQAGAEAFAMLGRRRYAAALCDLSLPDLPGAAVIAEACRRDPCSAGILLCRRDEEAQAVRALGEEVYDYILKPVDPNALLASVCRAVERHALTEELARKTAELARLERKLSEKSNMIRNVSHELKNPLSVVYGYSSHLLKQPDEFTRDELRAGLESIHGSAERLSSLLEEMAEATRLSAGKVALERRAVAAARLCGEAVETERFEAVRRSIDLNLRRIDPALTVNADPARAHQILSHLIGNAIKFTPEGGTVEVSAAEDEGFARFTVRDTGPGIAAEDLPHVFERFYHAAGARKAQTGLGLGLHIAKCLVELHGGHAWVESQPGEGSSFHFTLPVYIDSLARTLRDSRG